MNVVCCSRDWRFNDFVVLLKTISCDPSEPSRQLKYNSYTKVCLPVRGNTYIRALAWGLSPIQAHKP